MNFFLNRLKLPEKNLLKTNNIKTMKKEKLIEELQKLPEGTEVCIFDWKKNMGDDWGDGSSEGIYPDIEVEYMNLEGDEAENYKEQHDKEYIPWVALNFENDDYDDKGRLVGAEG